MIALMWGAGALGFLAGVGTVGLVKFSRAMYREGLPWRPRPREHAKRAPLTGPAAPALALAAFFARELAQAARTLDATPLSEIQRQRDQRGVRDLDYQDRPSLWGLLSPETLARIPVAELRAAMEEYGRSLEQAGEPA